MGLVTLVHLGRAIVIVNALALIGPVPFVLVGVVGSLLQLILGYADLITAQPSS